jgi:predicted pyridoxine 5'-phosphate oxidase superfamily flavin-nucleotide-binding protein
MRRTVERQRSGRVASGAADGTRQEAAHDWLAVWDDTTLAFADVGATATVRNLIESPPVEVTVVDPDTGRGFRFAGTARVLLSGPTFDRVRAFYSARGLHAAFEHVVFVAVESVAPAAAGAPESDEAAG